MQFFATWATLATPNISKICADELILVRGVYLSRKKTLSISCRTVKFVGSWDRVVFAFDPEDCPPKPAAPAPKGKGQNGTRPGDIRTYIDRFLPWDKLFAQFSKPKSGDNGGQGVDGGIGSDAGSFTFRGTFSLSKDEKIKFEVYVNGGVGGAGGNGGVGGEGGDAIPEVPQYSRQELPDIKAWNQIEPYMYGGTGGSGGTGGKGGNAGRNGTIDIAYDLLVDGQASTGEDPLTFLLHSGQHANGAAGEGGGGGNGGDHGKIQFWVRQWSGWVPDRPWVGRQMMGRDASANHKELWEYTMWWHKMPRGSTGSSGSRATDNTTKAADGAAVCARKSRVDLLKAQIFDAHHLSMVMERMSFEYFTQFATQVYDTSAPVSGAVTGDPTPRQRQIGETWNWVSEVLSSRDIGGDEGNAWKMLRGSLMSFNAQCLARSDMFKRALNAVPNPVVGIPDVNKAIENYKVVEAAASKTKDAIATTDRKRADVYEQLKALTGTELSLTTAQGKELDECDRLIREVQQAIPLQDVRTHALKAACADLKDLIKDTVKCEVEKIIEAVGDVVLDSHDAKPAKVISNVLSLRQKVATELKQAKETLDTDTGEHLNKSFIYDRLDTFTSGMDTLRDDLGKAMANTKEAQTKDKKYMARLQVSAQKFDQMCDSYLGQLRPKEKVEDVRKAFNELMDSIQYKNDLITEYNNCQARRLQLRNDLEATRIIVAKQKDTAGEMTNTDLQLLGAFLSKAESDIGRSTFEMVYHAARNFNCVALGPTSVFQCLNPLQSFAGVNSTVLDTAVKTYLIGQDINNFEREIKSFEGKAETITVRLNESVVPEMFRKCTRKVTEHSREVDKEFDQLTVKLAADDTTLDFKDSWWDVRLKSLDVFLLGATQKAPVKPDKTKTYNNIGMKIRTPGMMSYKGRKADSLPQDFQLPAVYSSYSYTYDVTTPGEKPFARTSDQVDSVHMEVFLGDRKVALPMQSPFATWIIEPYDDVDLTDCTSVEMVFKITHQTRA